MVEVLCKTCGKKFKAKASHVKNGCGKYCSRACGHEGMRKGEKRPCHVCGSVTYKTKKQLRISKSKKFFCTKSCQTKWRNEYFSGKRHANYTNGQHSYRSAIGRYGFKKECRLCKTTDKRVLAVHHIDRNRTNNAKENLAWLCHNCHFLVHRHGVGKDVGL